MTRDIAVLKEAYDKSMAELMEYIFNSDSALLRRFICANSMKTVYERKFGMTGPDATSLGFKAFNLEREEVIEALSEMMHLINENPGELSRIHDESVKMISGNMMDYMQYQSEVILQGASNG